MFQLVWPRMLGQMPYPAYSAYWLTEQSLRKTTTYTYTLIINKYSPCIQFMKLLQIFISLLIFYQFLQCTRDVFLIDKANHFTGIQFIEIIIQLSYSRSFKQFFISKFLKLNLNGRSKCASKIVYRCIGASKFILQNFICKGFQNICTFKIPHCTVNV